jgi:hypothetical protein
MKQGGAHVWYFPDGYLPEKVENTRLEPHEALMVLNTGSEPAASSWTSTSKTASRSKGSG